jgi:hypothetical protein
VVAKVRERLAASKQAAQNFDVEMFNLRKINELHFSTQHHYKISNSLAFLGNLYNIEDKTD